MWRIIVGILLAMFLSALEQTTHRTLRRDGTRPRLPGAASAPFLPGGIEWSIYCVVGAPSLLSIERQLNVAAVLLQFGTSTINGLYLPPHDLFAFGQP
jgi:hypothetical protein